LLRICHGERVERPVKDRQTAELATAPHELDAPDTFTELVVFELHDEIKIPRSPSGEPTLHANGVARSLAEQLGTMSLHQAIALVEAHHDHRRARARTRQPLASGEAARHRPSASVREDAGGSSA